MPTIIIAQLKVSHLRVEHMNNPNTVDAWQPRLSWINETVKPSQHGMSQSAYEIGVASTAEKARKGEFDVWDSGKQLSAESHLISYSGPTLQSACDYYWRVRTWDQNDKPSAWSATSHWGMGIKAEEWKAQWIMAPRNGHYAPMMRKEFSTRGEILKAKTFICGLGFFEMYVNGQRIGDDYLVPNITTYSKLDNLAEQQISIDGNFRDYRVLYLSYDITEHLRQGNNAVGVMLGNGWYAPDSPFASTYGQPCLRCQTIIWYKDGSIDTILSDPTWFTHPSPIVYADIYGGELYDARLCIPAWAEPGTDISSWEHAVLSPGPSGQMTAQCSPADKITEVLQPITLQQVAEEEYEVDFGKEIAGWIHFRDLKGTAGDTLVVKYESESPQGTQRYIFDGSGKECYQPHFTWFAFRKARISGIRQLTASQLTAEAVNTDVPVTCEFECSNPLFNKILEIWQRSQLDNMHCCIASDCPHRERIAYTGDGQSASEMVMLSFDAAAFYQKWIRDMRDTQNKETGYVPNSAPWAPHAGGGVPWGAAMSLMPWWYYVQFGDTKMLEDSYLNMKEQVRWMMNWITLDGVMSQQMGNYGRNDVCYWLNLGDWIAPDNKYSPDKLVHTFFLWKCCDFCSRAAQALGKQDEATHYRQMAQKVVSNFHRHFYNPKEHSYGPNGSNIFALAMGVPDTCRQAVINTLREQITKTCNNHIDVGFVGAKYYFELLSQLGMTDVAYAVMNQRDYPSYGHWIEQGATTTWEQWDGANSHNHPMFGGALTWFIRCLGGIQADEQEPGYKHVIISPSLTDMEQVRTSIMTPYGRVGTHITNKNGQRSITVTIPVGSHATLLLPEQSPQELTQGVHKVRF